MDQDVLNYWKRHQFDWLIRENQLGYARVRRYHRGETLCELGDPLDGLLLLVEGRVRVYVPSENARQLLLCFYEPPQVFGDMEIFEAAPRATATIEALTPSVCLSLPQAWVARYMLTDPVTLQQLCRALGRKLSRVIRNSALNQLHPLGNRVASYILATATESGEGELVFAGNLTHIAELLGTTFRHLHRTLQEFCRQGTLRKQARHYLVIQREALARRAAGVYVLP